MSNKPTDPSGGSALDVLPKGSVTAASTENMSDVVRAGQVILNYLCEKSRESGANTPVGWRGLWKELGIEQAAYAAALQSFIDAGAVDVELVGRDHIRLGPGGRVYCGLP